MSGSDGNDDAPRQVVAHNKKRALVGTLLAAIGAISYGVTVVFGRYFAEAGFSAPTVVGVRFSGAAVVILFFLAVTRRKIMPARRERLATVTVAFFGFFLTAQLFFVALQNGSAGMVALLFYAFPAIVLIGDYLLGVKASTTSVVALCLAGLGTSLIALAGDGSGINAVGVMFALLSAGTYAFGLLASGRWLIRTDPVAKSFWVCSIVGGAALIQGTIFGGLENPGGYWGWFVANMFATVGAYTFVLVALSFINPTRTGVIMTLEAVSAVIIGWLVLGETLGAIQLIGGAVVLGAAILIAADTSADEDAADVAQSQELEAEAEAEAET